MREVRAGVFERAVRAIAQRAGVQGKRRISKENITEAAMHSEHDPEVVGQFGFGMHRGDTNHSHKYWALQRDSHSFYKLLFYHYLKDVGLKVVLKIFDGLPSCHQSSPQ